MTPMSATRTRILVIDDDSNLRTMMTLAVEEEGFKTVAAVNGIDALAKIAQRPPDMIITDLMMPGQGGYEFLRELTAAGAGAIPVIVVTGRPCDPSMIAMIRAEGNVVEFAPKPVRMNAFLLAVHKHLKTASNAAPKRGLNDLPEDHIYRYDDEARSR